MRKNCSFRLLWIVCFVFSCFLLKMPEARSANKVVVIPMISASYNSPGKTGQTECWDVNGASVTCTGTGQDGDLLMGAEPSGSARFTDNGDGTVTDNLTGLIWLKNANCPQEQRNWEKAIADLAQMNSNGSMGPYANNCGDTSNNGSFQTDWRLPNIKELQTLGDFGYYNPALSNADGTGPCNESGGDCPFENVITTFYDIDNVAYLESNIYWSSTTEENDPTRAWFVDLKDGLVTPSVKSISYLWVWPVRGGG